VRTCNPYFVEKKIQTSNAAPDLADLVHASTLAVAGAFLPQSPDRSFRSRSATLDVSLSFRFPQSFQVGFDQPPLIIAHLAKKKPRDDFESCNAIFQSLPPVIWRLGRLSTNLCNLALALHFLILPVLARH
jgi:hypothetical protein